MERRRAAGPVVVLDERHVPLETDPPPRRRRSALLGGGVLVAASPAAVGAGLFVPGFAALGVGALLLLLPPRARREGGHGTPLRLVRAAAVATRGRATASARWLRHVVVRPSRAVTRFAGTSGREGAVQARRATSAAASAIAAAAAAAGSRGWSTARVWAPRAWRGFVAATQSAARAARSAALRGWVLALPLLRRTATLFRAGSERAATEIGALASSASRRLSAYVDSRFGPR